MRLLLILLVLISTVKSIVCDTKCNFQNCGDCIGNEVDLCVWCLGVLDKNETRRCQTQAYANSNKPWCSNIYDPNSTVSINTLSTTNRQLHPQSMKIQARPGTSVNFPIKYTAITDYPVDVYYLMDLSFATKHHTSNFEKQAIRIYSELSELSNNVKLGVGSFVEKPALPYVSPNYVAYTFKNHVPLTKNIIEIKNIFEDTKDIGNNNDQKAVLDALMQAIVCQDEVGWRKEARHIIVLISYGLYHSAGDGKMVGAIKPNDMKCHLQNNTHVSALEFDYPSVSQINRVVMDHNFTIVFSAAKNLRKHYELLADYIEGAKYVELHEGNSDIADIIINEYKDLIKSVQIRFEAPSYVNCKLSPNCISSANENTCYVGKNNTIEFNATVTIRHCPKNSNEDNNITITALGLNEVLDINVRAICKCDCEQQLNMKSSECNNHGSYQCGVCKCDNDRYGDKCQCKGFTTKAEDLSKCKDESNNLCSGRGTCRCGECVCQNRFVGKFCQIGPIACPHVDGQTCAGHGTCQNQKCQCDNEWTGQDCNIPDNNRECYARHSNEVCSGNGNCENGKCICKKSYSGIFCDDCPDCKEKRCKELEKYAECHFMKKQADCIGLFKKTYVVDAELVNRTEFNSMVIAEQCEKVEGDGSKLIFQYQYKSKTQIFLLIQDSLEVPPKVHTLVIVGSIIGSILFIGLVTGVIWKIAVDYHDYVEYKKFEEETKAGDLLQNPLYKEPCVKYHNPSFEKSKYEYQLI